MARPREFVEDEVLDRAMMCFWEKGYGSTSIDDLEKATGISRISLYNAFGDKEALFIRVMERYMVMASEGIEQTFENPDVDALIAFVSSVGDGGLHEMDHPGATLGCLMVNTVLDVHTMGENVLKQLQSYKDVITDKFSEFLKRCQDTGKLKQDLKPKECAEYIVGSMWGAMALTRLHKDSNETHAHTKMVANTINSWRA